MKRFVGVLLQVWALVCLPRLALTATVFEDGFESGTLGPVWTVSSSNDGRTTVTTNYAPATGQWHLVLDDRVSDAVSSVAQATFQLDLRNKKNVLLTFKAKSLGNEPDPSGFPFGDPQNLDGVSVSTDGGTNWSVVASLASVGTDWETFTVPLDFYASWSWDHVFGPDFRIRFSEYDNASAPLDGIAIDEVVVTAEENQRAVLELPNRVLEGSGPHTGHVLLAFAPTNTLTLSLSATPLDQLNLPATVEVPAGQTDVIFNFSVADDHLVNLTRTVIVNATGPEVTSFPVQVMILDDEAPVATLKLPAQLKEGELTQDNASLSLDRAPDVTLTVSLMANPWGELVFPYTVTIPPGSTQAVFTVQANDDNAIDGNIPVTLTAREPSMLPAIAQTMTADNEGRTLFLTLPEVVQESGTANGMATISGVLGAPLEVKLTSSDPAALTVPGSVIIPAGQTQGSFALTATDNAVRDGNRVVKIGASADTFTGTNAAITIHDNEVASYRFSGLGELVNISDPVTITVSARDASGNVISGFKGAVNLRVVLGDGTTQPLTPGAVDLAGPVGWTGTVTLPGPDATPCVCEPPTATAIPAIPHRSTSSASWP